MPLQIEHIDAICRKKGRDVLFIAFSSDDLSEDTQDLEVTEDLEDSEDSEDSEVSQRGLDDGFSPFCSDWENSTIRKTIIEWLDQHQIEWSPCGHVASENLMMSYQGWIYVDVPFDTKDPTYQVLRDYLETPEGTMRFSNVRWYYLPLEDAMKNAHHDEPGFWDRWAEDF